MTGEWAGVLVALVGVAATGVLALLAYLRSGTAITVAERAAVAAERAAAAQEALLPKPTPDIAWELVLVNIRDRYALRHIGTRIATNLRIDYGETYTVQPYTHVPDAMSPGDAVMFYIRPQSGDMVPSEFRVTCDQLADARVPVPLEAR